LAACLIQSGPPLVGELQEVTHHPNHLTGWAEGGSGLRRVVLGRAAGSRDQLGGRWWPIVMLRCCEILDKAAKASTSATNLTANGTPLSAKHSRH
jgi:hypothetical protein